MILAAALLVAGLTIGAPADHRIEVECHRDAAGYVICPDWPEGVPYPFPRPPSLSPTSEPTTPVAPAPKPTPKADTEPVTPEPRPKPVLTPRPDPSYVRAAPESPAESQVPQPTVPPTPSSSPRPTSTPDPVVVPPRPSIDVPWYEKRVTRNAVDVIPAAPRANVWGVGMWALALSGVLLLVVGPVALRHATSPRHAHPRPTGRHRQED